MQETAYAVEGAADDPLMGHKPSDRFGYPSDEVRAAYVKWHQAVEALNDELRAAYAKWEAAIAALGPNPLNPAPVPPVVIERSPNSTPSLTLLTEMGDDGPAGDRV